MATKAYFVDPFKIVIETDSGETLMLGFLSTMNYQIEQQWDNFFTTCLIALFDKYYDGSEKSIWGPINAGMYKNRLDSFKWVINDRDQERIRIGKRIKELRNSRNMEAKELAHQIGIDPGNLSRIEQGRFSVGFDTLNKIANVMNMNVDFVDK